MAKMSFRAPDPKPCDLVEVADAVDDVQELDQRVCLATAKHTAASCVADGSQADAGNGPRRLPVSVFCTDDHAGFRDVLRDLIGATPGFVLIGEACCGEDTIALVPQLRPDLVLMDIHMVGMSGFEAAARLVSDHADSLIVLMSADPIKVPPALTFRSGDVVSVAKSELCPRRLRDLWHGRSAPSPRTQ